MSADVLGRSDRCLADTTAFLARHADGGATEDADGVRLYAGAHPYPGPYCNGLVRTDLSLDAGTVLGRGRDFFAGRRRGYIVWARDMDTDLVERCRANGWHERPPVEGAPIICRDEPLEEPTLPIRRARTVGDAEAYLGVLAQAYGMEDAPPAILHAVFCSPAAVLGEGAVTVLTEVDGQVAAGGLGISVGTAGSLMWVATAPWARRRGLGPECLRAVTNALFAAGAERVYGQSSQMGIAQWRKLGFDVPGAYHRFLAPPVR